MLILDNVNNPVIEQSIDGITATYSHKTIGRIL